MATRMPSVEVVQPFMEAALTKDWGRGQAFGPTLVACLAAVQETQVR